ncbi:hypothetical protein RCL1_001715 [Eukaryota sp. TZLM3-RCL]
MAGHSEFLRFQDQDEEHALHGRPDRKENVHLRVVQRKNARTTVIENLDDRTFDLDKVEAVLKKDLGCNAWKEDTPDFGTVLCLSGDYREEVKNFILREGIVKDKDKLVVHGP